MSKAAYQTAVANLRTELDAMISAEAVMESEVISADGREVMFANRFVNTHHGRPTGSRSIKNNGAKVLLRDLENVVLSYEAWVARWS